MPPITLKFTSNTPFHKIDSVNELRETWKVCTKVKDSLENGSRLENLSWRLWFVHNTDESNRKQKLSLDRKESMTSEEQEEKREQKQQAPSPPLPPPPPEPLMTVIQQQIEYRRMLRRQQHEQLRQKITEQDYDQSCDVQEKQSSQAVDESTYHHYAPTALPNMDWQQHQPADNVSVPLVTENHHPNAIATITPELTIADQQQQQLQPANAVVAAEKPEEQSIRPPSSTANFYAGGVQVDGDTMTTTPAQSVPNSPVYTAIPAKTEKATTITAAAAATTNIQEAFSACNIAIPTTSCEQALATSWDLLLDNDSAEAEAAALYFCGAIPSPVPNGTLYSKLLSTLPRETLESVERLLTPQTHLQVQVPGGIMTSMQQQQDVVMPVGAALQTPAPGPTPPPVPTTQRQDQQLPLQRIIRVAEGPSSSSGSSSSAPTSPIRRNHHHTKNKSNKDVYISTLHFPAAASASKNTQHRNRLTTTTTVRRSLPVKSASSAGQPVCSNCSTTNTPLWRRSTDDELLCNACGLYLKLHHAPRPKHLKPHSGRKDARGEEDGLQQQPTCSNCATSTTPLWRRDDSGAPLCNACGLYLKLHNQRRPLSLKSDTIKKRQRVENSTETAAVAARRPAKKIKNSHPSSPIVQLSPSSQYTNMSQQHFYYQPSS